MEQTHPPLSHHHLTLTTRGVVDSQGLAATWASQSVAAVAWVFEGRGRERNA